MAAQTHGDHRRHLPLFVVWAVQSVASSKHMITYVRVRIWGPNVGSVSKFELLNIVQIHSTSHLLVHSRMNTWLVVSNMFHFPPVLTK